MAKPRLKLVLPASEKRTVAPGRRKNSELRTREYLPPSEVGITLNLAVKDFSPELDSGPGPRGRSEGDAVNQPKLLQQFRIAVVEADDSGELGAIAPFVLDHFSPEPHLAKQQGPAVDSMSVIFP